MNFDFTFDYAKANFFDRSKIKRALRRWEYTTLNAMGRKIRSKSVNSMRKKKKPSKPLMPPRVITGKLKKKIYSLMDLESKTVISGPCKLPGSKTGAPRILEYGGKNIEGKYVRVRPYMGPALRKTLQEMWSKPKYRMEMVTL